MFSSGKCACSASYSSSPLYFVKRYVPTSRQVSTLPPSSSTPPVRISEVSRLPSPSMSMPVTRRYSMFEQRSNSVCQSMPGQLSITSFVTLAVPSMVSPSSFSFGRYSRRRVVSEAGSTRLSIGAPLATVTLFTFVPPASRLLSSVFVEKSSDVESWRLLLAIVCPLRFTSLSCLHPCVTSHHVVVEGCAPRFTLMSSRLIILQLPSSRPFSRCPAAPVRSSSRIFEAPNSSIGSFSARLPVTESLPVSPLSSLPVSPSI